MKIIFGTTNINKKNQIDEFVKAKGMEDIEFMTMKDIGFDEEIIEDGSTFEENSMKKAKAVQKFCKKNNINEIIVTDDSGLCVDCLNGEPGVYSGRYASKDMEHDASQEENIKKVLENIEKTKSDDRRAKFVCVLTAVLPDGQIIQSRGETLGTIAKKIGPMGKLTYGPIFIPDGFNKVMNEMEPEEFSELHREKAFLQLLKQIRN